MGTVSRKQPLYDQLVDLLKEKIENEMEPGDMLPSERSLSERYGLSRTTVRLALKELEDLGLITRKHGKGTFVSEMSHETANLVENYSFTEQMRNLGRVPKTTLLEFEVREANKSIAEHMGLRLGDKVYRFKRLRIADDVPIMVETTYLPMSEFVGFSEQDIAHKSLYEVIEKDYHVKIRVAEEEFIASLGRGEDAKLLQISEGAPVLQLVRTTFSDKNVLIEYTCSVARSDQFKYKVSHVRA